MPAIYEHSLAVAASDLDEQGHANNVEYVRWMQTAALAHSAEQGWPPERYQELGSTFVVHSHRITYKRPSYEGDEVVVRTWVANFRRAFSLRKYKFVRASDETELARAETDWAFVVLIHELKSLEEFRCVRSLLDPAEQLHRRLERFALLLLLRRRRRRLAAVRLGERRERIPVCGLVERRLGYDRRRLSRLLGVVAQLRLER
ncbi:MAG: acyl-CoA thioesterase, partial [Planctomycetota bacterium]